MFCPSAVVDGSFIKTSMTCSHTGGMEGGAEGVIKVGMLAGALARGGGGGLSETEGVSGDTRPSGVVGMMMGSRRFQIFLLGLGLEH